VRRRVAVVAAVVLVAGAGGTALATGALGSAGPQDHDEPAVSPVPATATVARADLVDRVEEDGTLGYGDDRKVGVRRAGTVTWLAPEGATVRRGGTLFRLDEERIPLLLGTLPLYRRLATGTDGADVRQLEGNLRALGYTGFTVDERFTPSTAAAVRRWQDDLGLPETGALEPGDAVISPSPVRVAGHQVAVGDGAGPGAAVLTVTGTTRQVDVDLPVADQRLARTGAAVTVTLPVGGSVPGRITEVGTVAQAPASDDPDADATADATIGVTIALGKGAARAGRVDQAPVTVGFTAGEREDVLVVPVAALLALAEGGHGLEVVTGSRSHVVAVRTGLFADGRVEVSGDGITAGTRVGVPAA
jgi:multidrug efflux system membrane fusion protein